MKGADIERYSLQFSVCFTGNKYWGGGDNNNKPLLLFKVDEWRRGGERERDGLILSHQIKYSNIISQIFEEKIFC